ncbi:MAG: protease complex subunit PrcB family protein [Flavobacteriaceae bacterium]|nr:protease complex subunit PrcB family protein [Flavobacteriaceae bacterium]
MKPFKLTFLCLLVFIVGRTVSLAQDYPYKEILQNQYGGPETPQLHIVKEPKSVQKFYAFINKTRKPGFALPKIDFEKETLLILCLGEKRSGGFQIGIDHIEETPDQIVVFVKEESPQGDMVSTVIMRPFYIAKIKNTKKEITFKRMKI